VPLKYCFTRARSRLALPTYTIVPLRSRITYTPGSSGSRSTSSFSCATLRARGCHAASTTGANSAAACASPKRPGSSRSFASMSASSRFSAAASTSASPGPSGAGFLCRGMA
jgi:hypothetical protein